MVKTGRISRRKSLKSSVPSNGSIHRHLSLMTLSTKVKQKKTYGNYAGEIAFADRFRPARRSEK